MTLTRVTDRESFAYFGDHSEWLVAYAIHRDSDALSRSNFRVIRKDLESADPENVTVETFSHWLVGHTEEILVAPGSLAAQKAEAWQKDLADYPVANEEDFSNEEEEESLESMTRFVEWEIKSFTGDREQLAGFIISAWRESGRDTPGLSYTCWPNLESQNDRDTLATAIRQYRNWERNGTYPY